MLSFLPPPPLPRPSPALPGLFLEEGKSKTVKSTKKLTDSKRSLLQTAELETIVLSGVADFSIDAYTDKVKYEMSSYK